MKVRALAKRILIQIKNDKRTLALMLAAPLLILTLLYFVFEGTVSGLSVGIINAPSHYENALYENNIKTIRYYSEEEAFKALDDGEVIAVVSIRSGKLHAWLDGSNSVDANTARQAIEMAQRGQNTVRKDLILDVTYVYGQEDLSLFDNFAAILMSFLVFFFVFLITGISFLKERTTGTLEKILSTPIKRWEVVVGYVLGFGAVNVVQSAIISFYLVYVLNVMMVGSVWLVLLTTLVTAIAALTLGILLSTAANSEFQMIQFIPIVIVPQVFFGGLFQLSSGWEAFGHLMPLYYSAHALEEIMMKGSGLDRIYPDLLILIALSVIFMTVNTKMLKHYRRI
ncbi:ABC transporter permease [Anaerovorax sp. IOR16]|uniref:ABC transporter permease n=1 Tax=Anaerovorax sp. IOR16 TaxID=2773458 RepID=UPI0019D102A1|nr:ABC transporter permease [Anaerovorax sp. IOR16]